jgi:hypothetical protein
VNDESSGDRTAAELAKIEPMRELGRRSGEAPAQESGREKAALEPQSDREGRLPLSAGRSSPGNAAAVVAAGKTLIELDRTEEREVFGRKPGRRLREDSEGDLARDKATGPHGDEGTRDNDVSGVAQTAF